MIKTQIADVIVPELFAPYVIQHTKEMSVFVDSGIVQNSELLDKLVAQGGRMIYLPSFNALPGSDEVLSDSALFMTTEIRTDNTTVPILMRGKAWSTIALTGALADSEPMTAVGEMVAQWWNIQERKVLTSILRGIFANALKSTHINDISNLSGSLAIINAAAVLDTKQLLGDAATNLTAIAMHSAVYTALQKQNLIEYIPNAQGIVEFPLYLGYKVIIDDGIVPIDDIFSTYLFVKGAIVRGEGVPDSLTSIEMGRDILASDDILISRRAFCLHPIGLSWDKPKTINITPSNHELANGSNWIKVGSNKSIGIVMLKHRI